MHGRPKTYFLTPRNHQPAACLLKAVPNKSNFRSPQCHRSLLVKLNPAKRPVMGMTPQWKIDNHLPMDEITHRVLPLLEGRSSLPLLNTNLVPTLSISPPDPPHAFWTTMQRGYRSILLRQWTARAPPPLGYPFAHSLSPYPYMGLSKFLAGGIHQM